jgi:hypothetical protein
VTLQIAHRWFEYERLSDGITRIWEPHVIRVMQCKKLPARVVHGGHDPSFDGARLRVLAREYLERRC